MVLHLWTKTPRVHARSHCPTLLRNRAGKSLWANYSTYSLPTYITSYQIIVGGQVQSFEFPLLFCILWYARST